MYNPAIRIDWPVEPTDVPEKDQKWLELSVKFHGLDRMKGLL